MSDYIPWAATQNTRLYQHAVDNIGKKTFLLVPDILNPGYLKEIPLSKDFSDRDIVKIQEGNVSEWDVSLLYKVDQRVCGLAPVNSKRWTMKIEGEDILENLMYEMKELRNTLSHNSHFLILSGTQLFNSLIDLESLSMKILNALIKTAKERGCVFEDDKVEDFKKYVNDVILDVQKY